MPAGFALPAVAAERGRAALGDGVQDRPLPEGQAVEVVRVRAHDVGQAFKDTRPPKFTGR